MNVSVEIKSLISSFIYTLGFVSRRIRNSHDNSLVLMYHRIIPKNDPWESVIQDGMYVEPKTFEIHIRFLRRYFTIIPIFEFMVKIENQMGRSNEKPICILTFDDGWYDFYKDVFPILKIYEVPATVFLPTDFIGTKKWFWTDRLTHLFFQRDHSPHSARIHEPSSLILVNHLEALKGSFESKIERAIEMLKVVRYDEIEHILSELSIRWNLDTELPGRAFLSWDEVREMKKSGLITFGSHTASHRIFTTLTEEEMYDELRRSKAKLVSEDAIDPACIPFCYPNGNYNEKIAGMVKEAGYHLAVTTENGWNNSKIDPFRLRRIGIHQDMTSSKAMFGCRVTGII